MIAPNKSDLIEDSVLYFIVADAWKLFGDLSSRRYVCSLCKGRINPMFCDDHMKENHPEKA